MSHLNIAFDRFASIGTVMHYILVISIPYNSVATGGSSCVKVVSSKLERYSVQNYMKTKSSLNDRNWKVTINEMTRKVNLNNLLNNK